MAAVALAPLVVVLVLSSLLHHPLGINFVVNPVAALICGRFNGAPFDSVSRAARSSCESHCRHLKKGPALM